MTKYRSQEPGRLTVPPRSDRILSQQDLWYFRTREQDLVGPFRFRSEAESNLDQFLEGLKNRIGDLPKA